jgi:hypothetical protein
MNWSDLGTAIGGGAVVAVISQLVMRFDMFGARNKEDRAIVEATLREDRVSWREIGWRIKHIRDDIGQLVVGQLAIIWLLAAILIALLLRHEGG